MTTPSVPRCGRMDEHEPHQWTRPGLTYLGIPLAPVVYACPGAPIHEGGARCEHCGDVVCRCEAELARERHEEWWAE